MKQVNNGYLDIYYLTEEGIIYNAATQKFIKPDNKHLFLLKREDNTRKKIAQKTLYKLIYNKNYCIDNIDNIDNEEWRAIENTDNVYYVSNMGRVKSYSGYVAIILKPTITKNGYNRLDIIEEGHRTSKLVHRLVAAAFMPPPDNIDMQLHHKDFNKNNNKLCNLEWLSIKQHAKKHSEREDKGYNGSTKPKTNNNK